MHHTPKSTVWATKVMYMYVTVWKSSLHSLTELVQSTRRGAAVGHVNSPMVVITPLVKLSTTISIFRSHLRSRGG